MAVLTRSILNLPEAFAELAIIAVAVACFVSLHAFLQRHLRSEVLRRHNDVAGYLFSAVGVLYAVLLGFVVVTVWQKYDATVANVEGEVDGVADLYHVVDGFPTDQRLAVRSDLNAYVKQVLLVEWPEMVRDLDVSDAGSVVLDRVSYRIDNFLPRDQREIVAQQAAIGNMQRLLDARRERLIHAVPSVPFVLWFALFSGALAMVAFCYLFGVENRPAQLLMTAILVGLVAILITVIAEFATPFSGSVSIAPDGWTYLAHRLSDIR